MKALTTGPPGDSQESFPFDKHERLSQTGIHRTWVLIPHLLFPDMGSWEKETFRSGFSVSTSVNWGVNIAC